MTKKDREHLEEFLKEHPIGNEEDDPDLFDDNRLSKANQTAVSRLVKKLLDGEIK